MKLQKKTQTDTGSFMMLDYLCVALLLGSIWGFFEVFFKDVLRMGGRPYAAAVVTGIGVMIMAAGYGLFRRAWIAPAIAMFSILSRMIIVPVLGCSPMCRANAVLALALLGAFTGAAFFASSKSRSNFLLAGGLCVGSGTLLSGIAFYHAGLACAPCQYLSGFQKAGGLSSFLTTEIAYWAIFAMVLFYPGYAAGTWLSNTAGFLKNNKPLPYYAGMLCGSFIIILLTGLILVK